MCPTPCPDCGSDYDPVSGWCRKCEGELVLYRVGGFRQEWFDEREDQPLGASVSKRSVGRAVDEMVAKGCSLVTVQRL